MDFELSQDHQMIRETIREFVRREVTRDYLRETDAERRFPTELWQKAIEARLMDWPLPEDAGGVGGDLLGTTIIIEELAIGSFSLATIYLTEAFSAVSTLTNFGSPEQKLLLEDLAAGKILFAFGFTEPGGGQDVLGAMATRAEDRNGTWVLNGAKIFTTLASESDHIVTLARTSRGAKRHDGLTMFLVPTHARGVTVSKISTIAYASTPTCEVAFNDVELSVENIIGEVDNGWRQVVHTLDYEKIIIAALVVGLAQAALRDATDYAKQRHAFGAPIGKYQAIQHYLARSDIQIEAARLLTYKAAWMAGRGRCTLEATRAKWAATEACADTTDRGMRILGGYGVTTDFDMQRYFRDARVLLFGPITNEMALNVVGELGLGLPRSY